VAAAVTLVLEALVTVTIAAELVVTDFHLAEIPTQVVEEAEVIGLDMLEVLVAVEQVMVDQVLEDNLNLTQPITDLVVVPAEVRAVQTTAVMVIAV
jgi:hypothetical protein